MCPMKGYHTGYAIQEDDGFLGFINGRQMMGNYGYENLRDIVPVDKIQPSCRSGERERTGHDYTGEIDPAFVDLLDMHKIDVGSSSN